MLKSILVKRVAFRNFVTAWMPQKLNSKRFVTGLIHVAQHQLLAATRAYFKTRPASVPRTCKARFPPAKKCVGTKTAAEPKGKNQPSNQSRPNWVCFFNARATNKLTLGYELGNDKIIIYIRAQFKTRPAFARQPRFQSTFDLK